VCAKEAQVQSCSCPLSIAGALAGTQTGLLPNINVSNVTYLHFFTIVLSAALILGRLSVKVDTIIVQPPGPRI